jgi:hypothetical protein
MENRVAAGVAVAKATDEATPEPTNSTEGVNKMKVYLPGRKEFPTLSVDDAQKVLAQLLNNNGAGPSGTRRDVDMELTASAAAQPYMLLATTTYTKSLAKHLSGRFSPEVVFLDDQGNDISGDPTVPLRRDEDAFRSFVTGTELDADQLPLLVMANVVLKCVASAATGTCTPASTILLWASMARNSSTYLIEEAQTTEGDTNVDFYRQYFRHEAHVTAYLHAHLERREAATKAGSVVPLAERMMQIQAELAAAVAIKESVSATYKQSAALPEGAFDPFVPAIGPGPARWLSSLSQTPLADNTYVLQTTMVGIAMVAAAYGRFGKGAQQLTLHAPVSTDNAVIQAIDAVKAHLRRIVPPGTGIDVAYDTDYAPTTRATLAAGLYAMHLNGVPASDDIHKEYTRQTEIMKKVFVSKDTKAIAAVQAVVRAAQAPPTVQTIKDVAAHAAIVNKRM